MDFGPTPDDAAAMFGVKQLTSMGTSFSLNRQPAPSAMSPEQVYRAFVEMARADPSYLHRLAAAFDYAKPFKRTAIVEPMPFHKIVAVECAISDRGAATAKRERWDTGRLRFNTRIQLTTKTAQAISAPSWTGVADFRTAKRAKLDADRLHRQKTFSDAYRAFLGDVIALAEAKDQMVGFLRATTDGDGTPHVEMQVIVADRAGLEAGTLDEAYLITKDATGVHMIRLPSFATTTSKGKPLSGSFSLQSRGVRSGVAEKSEWATGELKVERL